LLRNQGFDVDDDNEPAPEKIPTGPPTIPAGQTWDVGSIDARATEANDHRCPPKLNNLSDVESHSMLLFSLFLWFFPMTYLQTVLLCEVNKGLSKEGNRPCGLGEFLRFLGLWFYMAKFKGFTRQQYWSPKDIQDFRGAPVRLTPFMSKNRFDMIL
jgi:hypothetical protein